MESTVAIQPRVGTCFLVSVINTAVASMDEVFGTHSAARKAAKTAKKPEASTEPDQPEDRRTPGQGPDDH
ncbi:hypothetical protein [Micromonospora sp. LOL_024]|uniref:hypothetical protein n=1 Tax=Micromonospora sp. LOL_024 TaxID=3345412 RepID=UPI003A8A89F9